MKYLEALLLAFLTILAVEFTVVEFGSVYSILTPGGHHIIPPYFYMLNFKQDLWAYYLASLALSILLIKRDFKKGIVIFLITVPLAFPVIMGNRIIPLLYYFLILAIIWKSFKEVFKEYTLIVALTFVSIEALALIANVLISLNIRPGPLIYTYFFDLVTFYSFFPLNGPLLAIFLFSWIIPFILHGYNTKAKRFSFIDPKIALVISLISAAFLGLMPYFPWLNPKEKLIGVDAVIRYSPHLKKMLSGAEIRFAIRSDRPLMYLMMYYMGLYLGVSKTVKIMPFLCSVFFSFSSYILAKELFKKKEIVSLATILAPFSTITTMGVFAGLYTNWFAYSFSFLTLAFILKSLRSKRMLIPATLFIIITMGYHPYHWGAFTASLVLAFIIILITGIYRKNTRTIKKSTVFLLPALISLLLFFSIIYLKWRNPLSHFMVFFPSKYLLITRHPFQLFNSGWWSSLFFFTYNYGIGSFVNLPLYIISIIGTIRLNPEDPKDSILISWLIAVSIMITANPYNRFLYVLPTFLYEVKGLEQFSSKRGLLYYFSLQQLNYAIRFVRWMTMVIP